MVHVKQDIPMSALKFVLEGIRCQELCLDVNGSLTECLESNSMILVLGATLQKKKEKSLDCSFGHTNTNVFPLPFFYIYILFLFCLQCTGNF